MAESLAEKQESGAEQDAAELRSEKLDGAGVNDAELGSPKPDGAETGDLPSAEAARPAPQGVFGLLQAAVEEVPPETGVSVQVPEGVLPALVDLDGLGEVPRPLPPPPAEILLWRHLACSQVEAVWRATSLAELRDIVGLCCPDLLQPAPQTPQALLLELLLYVLQHARDNELSEEQTSVVLSIALCTHQYASASCFGNIRDTFEYFRALLLAHCVNRPPRSLDLFEPDVAQRFANFFGDVYFRHFGLVKSAFTPYVTVDVDIGYDPRVPGRSNSGAVEPNRDKTEQ